MKKKVIAATVLSIGLLGGITTLAHANETWYCDNHHEEYANCGGSMHTIHHQNLKENNSAIQKESYTETGIHHEEDHTNNGLHHQEHESGEYRKHTHGSCHR